MAAKADDSSFNIYLNWLCTGKICIDYDVDGSSSDHKIWNDIALAYSLSRSLDDKSFADAITDAVALMLGQAGLAADGLLPTDDETLECMEDKVFCHGYSRLWHLLSHHFATLEDIHDVMMPSWPPGFLCLVGEELGRRLHEGETTTTKAAAIACMFHAHSKKEECYRLKWPSSL